jgi:hypothetical protein
VRVQRVSQRLQALYSVGDLDAVTTVAFRDRDTESSMSGSDAFELLVRASGQNRECVSLTSVWAFVNVMFWQLWDLDHVDGVAGSYVAMLDADQAGSGGWFKLKLISLIVQTARDFAPRCPLIPAEGAAGDAADPHERGLAQVDGVVKWKDSNHQCVLFQQDGSEFGGGGVSFMAVNHALLKRSMGRVLAVILEQAGFELQPSEQSIVEHAPEIFSVISGVHRTAQETGALLDGS